MTAILTNSIQKLTQNQREHLAPVTAILGFTLILFAPFFQGRSFSMMAAHMYAQYPWAVTVKDDAEVIGRGYPQTDQAETFYPASVFATNALRSGQFPMWLPYSFSGIPILEVGIGTGLLYPPKLLTMLFLSPIRQHDFLMFSHLLLAGLGMYALLRWWGANAVGSVIGAIVWALNGYAAFYMVFEHAAIAAGWFPLMLLWSDMAIKRRSVTYAVATGVAAGMSVLSFINHVYVGLVVLLCWFAVITVTSAVRLYRNGQRRTALFCLSLPLISATVAVALSAASWLSMLDLLSNSSRQPHTLAGQLNESIPVGKVLRSLVRPVGAGGVAGKTFEQADVAFIGIPAVLLAIVALLSLPYVLRRRSVPIIFAVVVLGFSLAFATGWRPLIILLRAGLPYMGAIHPYTGLYLCSFAFAVLAAFGFTKVCARLASIGIHRHLSLGLGCALVAFESFQLIGFAWAINPVQPVKPEWLLPETAFIEQLKSLQGEFHVLPVRQRLESNQWTPPVLTGKVAACFGLNSSSGYESLLPLPTAAFWRTVEHGGRLASDMPPAFRPDFSHDRLAITLLEKASVGLLAGPPGVKPLDISGNDPTTDGRLKLVYQGSDGSIFRLTRALPRAFLVPRVIAAPNPPAAIAMFVDKNFDASKSAVVIGDDTAAGTGLTDESVETTAPEPVATIVSDRLNSVEIDFVTARNAMMVLNDSWAEGWKAFVDGVERPVLRVNYAFRGVVVPEGRHRVLFLYRPAFLLVGLAVTGLTLFLVMIFYARIGLKPLYNSYLKRRTHS